MNAKPDPKPITEKEIISHFPKLYEFCYFECGEGWFSLLWHLSKEIQEEIDKETWSEEDGPPFVIQVKEKFGTLRYYMSSQTDKMSEIIRDMKKKVAVYVNNVVRGASCVRRVGRIIQAAINAGKLELE